VVEDIRGNPTTEETGIRDSVSISSPRSPTSRSTRSKAHSAASSFMTSVISLPPLQAKGSGGDVDGLEPLAEEEVEPGSFDLVVPCHGSGTQYSLETQSEQLFSKEHLRVIFDDHTLLKRFTSFLCTVRPGSLPLLTYYLDSVKALRAISYANAIVRDIDFLEGHEFANAPATPTTNEALEDRAEEAFDALTREDLPAYITHTWIQTVSLSIKRRIIGTLPPRLREMSEGLAEVFCLTDPSRPDNPIVFASEGIIC
jgi:hypothetical protein